VKNTKNLIFKAGTRSEPQKPFRIVILNAAQRNEGSLVNPQV